MEEEKLINDPMYQKLLRLWGLLLCVEQGVRPPPPGKTYEQCVAMLKRVDTALEQWDGIHRVR